ncbi:MAG: hypothetical protein BHW58_03375 [Azospirillum sp. 51_20]|nr:MAG: hypothetical protein BHW58_03375 [Azospirillum sp. 51_20]
MCKTPAVRGNFYKSAIIPSVEDKPQGDGRNGADDNKKQLMQLLFNRRQAVYKILSNISLHLEI